MPELEAHDEHLARGLGGEAVQGGRAADGERQVDGLGVPEEVRRKSYPRGESEKGAEWGVISDSSSVGHCTPCETPRSTTWSGRGAEEAWWCARTAALASALGSVNDGLTS
jgi:hypothetical protein